MDMLNGLGTAVIVGLAWLFGVSAGVLLLTFILEPLDLPPQPSSRENHFGEWLLAAIFLIWYLHLLGLLALAVYAVMRWFRSRNEVFDPDVAREPFMPRMSLLELVAMLLSIGFAPVVFKALYETALSTAAALSLFLVVAVLFFGIAFLRALQRMNSNNVPPGIARAALIFVYPYMIYSGLFVCGRGAVLLAYLGNSKKLDELMPHLPLRIGIAAIFLATGAVLVRVAKGQAARIALTQP